MVFGPDENLYVSNLFGAALTDRGVFRYNGVTGEFMDVFVPGNSGGLGARSSSCSAPTGTCTSAMSET